MKWRSRSGPVPVVPSGNKDAGRELARICHDYPGTLAWYDEQSGEWRGLLSQAPDADAPLIAPSPSALTRMVAARYLEVS